MPQEVQITSAVDLILMTVSDSSLKCLLKKRTETPFMNCWAMPGGIVRADEDLDSAAERQLNEQTHLIRKTYFRQLYTFGNTDRDPRGRIVTTVYLSMAPESNIRLCPENEDTAWFTIERTVLKTTAKSRESILSLHSEKMHAGMKYRITDTANRNYTQTRSSLMEESTSELAFDHIKAINMALDMVQNRAAATGILFNLLPEETTLREIQTVYEAVQGEKTDTGNFRRDIVRMLKKTEHTKTVNGKSAALYRFNPMYQYLKENL